MAREASENINSPTDEAVQAAVANIEASLASLLSEKGIYMQKCKKIRDIISGDYEEASDKGISKKLLKKVIKGREYERKNAALTDDLEDDERSEFEMLVDKLGEFGNTPLGQSALAAAKADGKATLAAVGA